ncbi:MAG: putative enzyme related to lactoylglutathione lyase [Cyclobacteriaceae bacterium]|jgi:predicted enzyme related to lactoylglutathione lyase
MEEKEPKITGVGGIFFKCDNPKALREWYGSTFGLDYNDYGIQFQSRSLENPEQKEYLQWSSFSKDSDYMQKEYMINYRVQNIEKLIENMRAAGVTFCDELETYEYGKFIHVLDPEGNKMELWEPIDTIFTSDDEKDKKD